MLRVLGATASRVRMRVGMHLAALFRREVGAMDEKLREGMFRNLKLMSSTGTAVMSFLVAMVVLRYSKVDLTLSILLSALFSVLITIARVLSERH